MNYCSLVVYDLLENDLLVSNTKLYEAILKTQKLEILSPFFCYIIRGDCT